MVHMLSKTLSLLFEWMMAHIEVISAEQAHMNKKSTTTNVMYKSIKVQKRFINLH